MFSVTLLLKNKKVFLYLKRKQGDNLSHSMMGEAS